MLGRFGQYEQVAGAPSAPQQQPVFQSAVPTPVPTNREASQDLSGPPPDPPVFEAATPEREAPAPAELISAMTASPTPPAAAGPPGPERPASPAAFGAPLPASSPAPAASARTMASGGDTALPSRELSREELRLRRVRTLSAPPEDQSVVDESAKDK